MASFEGAPERTPVSGRISDPFLRRFIAQLAAHRLALMGEHAHPGQRPAYAEAIHRLSGGHQGLAGLPEGAPAAPAPGVPLEPQLGMGQPAVSGLALQHEGMPVVNRLPLARAGLPQAAARRALAY